MGRRQSRRQSWPRRVAAALREILRPSRPSPRRLLSAVLLAFVITGALTSALWLRWLDFPEMLLLDWRFRERGPGPSPDRLLILALDDRTMSRARRLSPVPRDLLAAIVRRLSEGGAKTIALDVLLPDRLSGDEDGKLASAMLSAGNVILPAVIDEQGHPVLPHPYFLDVARGVRLAHVEEAAVDHIARWDRPVRARMASLALAASAHFRGLRLDDLLTARTPADLGRRLDQTLDAEGRLLINFVGPSGAIPRLSAADLLDGRIAPASLRGRLVLVGGTWSGAQDLHFVPFAHGRADLGTSIMPGVELQANCIATLLARPPLRQASLPVNASLLLITVLLISLVMVQFQPTAALLLSAALGALWTEAALLLFLRGHFFLRLAPPLAGIAAAYLTAALVTERRAQHLRRHFRRYVGRQLADEVAEMSDAEIGRMGKARVAVAFSPRAEQVLDGHPLFRWRDCGAGSRYELELYRRDQLLWKAPATAAQLPYPTDRPPLPAGSYQWQIYVKTPEGKQDADGAAFTVPDAVTAQKIRSEIAAAGSLMPDPSAVNLPLVALYVTHQLYTPAEAALQHALMAAPDDPQLRLLLAHVYFLMGRSRAWAELLAKGGH